MYITQAILSVSVDECFLRQVAHAVGDVNGDQEIDYCDAIRAF